MGEARSPWRALRPVLLAGAAAVSWLTLSSTAASADTLSDTASLGGGVTSSVSSITDKLAGPVSAVQAPDPAVSQPSNLLQPLAAPVTKLTDSVVSSVPVVTHVVPAGTVSAVSAPMAGVADGAAAAVVEVVVPPVTEDLPVLEPVLEPVADLGTGTAALPVPLPELPGTAVTEELPEIAADTPASNRTEAAGSPSPEAPAAATTLTEASDVPGAPSDSAGEAAFAGTSERSRSASALTDQDAGRPGAADPSPDHAPSPAVPGSGSGSTASSAGSPGFTAWLSPFDFNLPFTRPVLAGEALEHAPSPVSFDPGSSPD
ncbi:hypothetical protein [Pseudarthrobacter sp. NS4]|uniref:hypothetical protein n=1 Tax=Pseudarthrobacter sp. NS4 TaxID=2973976 RepID=UPI0021611A55|nr:hypothetical protein [Pseudarthrobacter sp. NS4]